MTASSNNFRSDIQGLRALAVLAVIIFHYNPALLPGGFIGVDVFLVISGYLITKILMSQKLKSDQNILHTLKFFYFSRIKRIAPAYFVMLFGTTVVAAILYIPSDYITFYKSLKSALYFNSNHYFAGFGDYFSPSAVEQPLLHTWSLAVEIQFYLLVPLLVLLLTEKMLKAVYFLLIVALITLAEYRLRMQGIEQATYYSLFARIPEFLMGGLAALYIKAVPKSKNINLSLSILGLLLILISFAVLNESSLYPGIAVLLPAIGASLLIFANASEKGKSNAVSNLLSFPILVWLGAISYSLYLWHWPVLAFLRYYTGVESLSIGYSVFFIVLTVLLASASYYLVENPMRKQRTLWKKWVGWILLISGVTITTQTGATVNTKLTPESLPLKYQRYADPDTICHGKIVGDCLKGDINSNLEVLVLGDSHAAMLNIFFDNLGKELGFKARIITASSCATIPEFDYQRIPEWAQESCIAQISEAKQYIENAKIIFLASAWQFHTQYPTFHSSIEKFINAIKPQQTLYIMSQVPKLSNNPQRAARLSALGFSVVVSIDKTYLEANKKIEFLINNHRNINFLKLNDLPVFNKAPLYKLSDGANHLIYFDDNHLNEVGVKYYAKEAASMIQLKLN